MRTRTAALACLAALASATPALADSGKEAASPAVVAPAEKIFPAFGSRAPELSPSEWLRGEPVKTPAAGKLQLVFCWSTLTSPAVKAVPVMNDIHRKFAGKGVTVVGVSVWEESATRVKDFLRGRGEAMAFRVAFDGRGAGGTVSKRWLEDADLNRIPYVFAIMDGKVLWHGEPADLRHSDIEAMIGGTYDIAKAEGSRAAEEAARRLAEPVAAAIEDLLADKKIPEALARCDELEKLLPERDRPLADMLRAEAHFENGDFPAGFRSTRKYVDAHPNDPETQAMTALAIVSEPRFDGHRDFELALRCVNRAIEAAPIDPYRMLKARITYASGDYKTADSILASLKSSTNSAVRTHLELILPEIAARRPWPIPPNQDCACGAH